MGNHDRRVRRLPEEWELDVHEAALFDPPFAFSHDALDTRGFTWRGHVHPVVTLRSRFDRVRVPCFLVGEHQGILPAFSELTGGAETSPGPGERLYGIAGPRVVLVGER